jgi:hypothetical protein
MPMARQRRTVRVETPKWRATACSSTQPSRGSLRTWRRGALRVLLILLYEPIASHTVEEANADGGVYGVCEELVVARVRARQVGGGASRLTTDFGGK